MITTISTNMYYTSKNKTELEAYNILVSQSENYDGVTTIGWAKVVEHQNGEDFAILAHYIRRLS